MAAHAGVGRPRSWGLLARLQAFTDPVHPETAPGLSRRTHGTLREAALRAAFNAEAD